MRRSSEREVDERQVISDMLRRIVDAAHPSKVLLYGSHARNEAGPASDVDLLVLFDELTDRREVVSRLYNALSGSELPKDVVVATTAEFDRYKNVVNTIYWFAEHEGRLLYERDA
jgi:predicted nucleotidyltransferase